MFLITLVAIFLNFSFADNTAAAEKSMDAPVGMSEAFQKKFMAQCKSDRKSYFGKPSSQADGKDKCIESMCECALSNASKITDSRKIMIVGNGNADESVVINKIARATHGGKTVDLAMEYGHFAGIFEKECESNQQFNGDGNAAYGAALDRLNSIEIVTKPAAKPAPAGEAPQPAAKPAAQPKPIPPPKKGEGMPPVRPQPVNDQQDPPKEAPVDI